MFDVRALVLWRAGILLVQLPTWTNNVSRGEAYYAKVRDRIVIGNQNCVMHLVLDHEFLNIAGPSRLHGHADDFDAPRAVFLFQFVEGRNLANAVLAPGVPEVQHYDAVLAFL